MQSPFYYRIKHGIEQASLRFATLINYLAFNTTYVPLTPPSSLYDTPVESDVLPIPLCSIWRSASFRSCKILWWARNAILCTYVHVCGRLHWLRNVNMECEWCVRKESTFTFSYNDLSKKITLQLLASGHVPGFQSMPSEGHRYRSKSATCCGCMPSTQCASSNNVCL